MTTLTRITHDGCQSVFYLIDGALASRDAYYDRFDRARIVDSFTTRTEGRGRDGCTRFRHTCEAR